MYVYDDDEEEDEFDWKFPIRADLAVEKLFDHFGRAILMALDSDDEIPPAALKSSVTFEETQDPAYVLSLSGHGVAVLCGAASDNLCGVQFKTAKEANVFLAKNSSLKGTLVTKGPPGVVIWVRIRGDYPPERTLVTCAWIADGQCVKVHHPDRLTYEFRLFGGQPVELDFSELIWDLPDLLRIIPFVIETQYGAPTMTDRRKRKKLNHYYWAGLFNVFAKLSYHAREKRFVRRTGDDMQWTPVSDEHVMSELRDFVHNCGETSQSSVIKRSIHEQELRIMLRHLSLVAVGDFDDEQSGLVDFVNNQCETKTGGDVTSEELFVAYRCFCQNQRLSPLTQHEFQRQLPPFVRNKFGIAQSHDIQRDGTHRRGYWNIGIKELETMAIKPQMAG